MLSSLFLLLLISGSTIAVSDVLTNASSTCPDGGIWSEWVTTGSCASTCGACFDKNCSLSCGPSSTCGACSVAARKRTCSTLCGDCPCDGPSEDVGPCGIDLCAFPKKICCGIYWKTFNARTNEFFCSDSGVAVIPEPQCPKPTCIDHPDAIATCDKTFSGRCRAATNTDGTYSCPTGQLFLSGSKAPVYTCDRCQASCSNAEWTLSRGDKKVSINRFVGNNPIVACIAPPSAPPCGFLPDAVSACKKLYGDESGRECYAATYSTRDNTYSCPGGILFFTGSKLESFATCTDARCALTCSNGRWTDGSANDWGKLGVACIAFPAAPPCSALRDATVTCNRTFPGRCSPAFFSSGVPTCASGRFFVYGSRSLVQTTNGASSECLQCRNQLQCTDGVWNLTGTGWDVSMSDFVDSNPIVCCVN